MTSGLDKWGRYSGKSSLLKYFLELNMYLPHNDEYYNEDAKKVENFISVFFDKGLYYMSNIKGIKSNILQDECIPYISTSHYFNALDNDINDLKDLMFSDFRLEKDRIITILNTLYMSKHNFEIYPSHHLLNIDLELSTFMYIPTEIEIVPKKLDKVFDWAMNTFLKNNASNKIDRREAYKKFFFNDIQKDDYYKFLIISYLQKSNAPEGLIILKDKKRLVEEYNKFEFEQNEKITEKNYKKYFSKRVINFKSIKNIEKFIYFKKYKDFFDYDFIDGRQRRYNHLSTGEQTLFGLLLNIFFQLNLTYNYSKNSDPHIFCLDEPDISLHPSWQKKYINEILTLFKKFDKKIHLLITTHSPFILSDIPKQNIIFLDTYQKEDKEVKNGEQKIGNCKVLSHDEVLSKKQTFGANIHTLLSDSFFMEDGLMGEFAKSKINEIKEFYEDVIKEDKEETSDFRLLTKKYEKNKTKFEEIQSIIGEPFLKTVIKNYLDEVENILFDNAKAKEMAIKRFIDEFGEDSVSEVLNDKN